MATTAPPRPNTTSGILQDLPWGELAIPGAIVAIVLAMIAPLPAFVVDALISLNIGISVVMLLAAVFVNRPADFNVFPTLLLLMTLFRLALNVSSSRLILLNGNTGTSAAGHVIEAFGNFVVGGNYVIGSVMFLVLIAIQYIVINHGAVRISEVTARFTLDAMPGKQVSIDADLNNGLIDEQEARRRRKELAAEAEFYGAMDGASRFTQRDAVASILITAINILAGVLVGVLQQNMEIVRALQTYAILTIGDGLVTVIPALMISVSGGLIITRANNENRLSQQVQSQLFDRWQVLTVTTAVMGLLALFPGLPAIPFLALGTAAGLRAWRLRERETIVAVEPPPPAPKPKKDDMETNLRVDPIAVELGLGLISFLEGGPASVLLRRIGSLRKQMASDLGFVLPPVRVTDNTALRAREYVISMRGVEIGRFELLAGHQLALETGTPTQRLNGIATKDPAFGLTALWIPQDRLDEARAAGYTVVDPLTVLVTQFGELMRRYSHELFTRQEAKRFLDRVNEESPKAVEDLTKSVSLALVQRVIQNLLRERVSIRDASTIVEALSEASAISRNHVLLTEFVRQAIRRQVVRPYTSPNGALSAFFLDPVIEKRLESAVEHGEVVSHFSLSPSDIRDFLDRVQAGVGTGDTPCALVTSASVRFFARQMLESQLGNVFALSHSEIPPGTKLVSLGIIR